MVRFHFSLKRRDCSIFFSDSRIVKKFFEGSVRHYRCYRHTVFFQIDRSKSPCALQKWKEIKSGEKYFWGATFKINLFTL